MDALTALAEPTRRRIADELRTRECSVTDLVAALGMSQPAISKHLRVLREAGVVAARVRAQQRIYRLEPGRSANWTPGSRPTGCYGPGIWPLSSSTSTPGRPDDLRSRTTRRRRPLDGTGR